MVLNLNLTLEIESSLARSAERAGVPESEYVTQVLAAHLQAKEKMDQAPERSILELRGLGAAMWRQELNGRDAQDLVNEERNTWDSRL